MKAILCIALCLVCSAVTAKEYGGYLMSFEPTDAPPDCNCLVCDCEDCGGYCGPQENKTPIKTASIIKRKQIDRLDAEIDLLKANEVTSKGRLAPERVVSAAGEWRWVQTGRQRVQVGTDMVCNGRTCQAVPRYESRPTYGWRFIERRPEPEPYIVPIKPRAESKAKTPITFANNTDYAAPLPDGMTYENPPNSAVQVTTSGYPANGPAVVYGAASYGCSGEASSGCSGSYGSGCAGGSGRVGLFGRRRGLFGFRR